MRRKFKISLYLNILVFLANCIDYRNNLQCTGDVKKGVVNSSTHLMLLATTDSTPTYQSAEGYGQCASWCIGTPDVVSFNWILYPNGAVTCQCLRKVFDRRFFLKSVARNICRPPSVGFPCRPNNEIITTRNLRAIFMIL